VVGTVKRSTLFLVVASKANYNLLLGREWIHGVGDVPSTMHQRLALWREDGVLENIEAEQSYFIAEVDKPPKRTSTNNWQKLRHVLLLNLVIKTMTIPLVHETSLKRWFHMEKRNYGRRGNSQDYNLCLLKSPGFGTS
jgi:hypothetical protein